MIESEDYEGEQCPNCESRDINGDTIESSSATEALRKVNCDECGATWTEIYVVSGYCNLEVPEKK